MNRPVHSFAPLVVLLLFSSRADALGERDRFNLAEVAELSTAPTANATRRMAWEIDKRTSIDVSAAPMVVQLADPSSLARAPFLYARGDRGFAPPSTEAIAALRKHLESGGMLFLDGSGAAFDASVRALCAQLFAGRGLEQIGADHVLYRSFYLLRAPMGRLAAQPFLEGLVHDGRVVILYSQNDLGGAWARSTLGQWDHEVIPGGEAQREMAFRLGVNIAMYALCQDYKADQVHVPFILRRRKWQSE